MVPYIFTKKILAGEPIIRYGDGSSSRDYTNVSDIVSGTVAAVNKPFDFEVINLGNHQPVTLTGFITLVEKLTGKKAQIEEAPRNPADVLTTYADISKAKKLLGWEPKTKLEDGMKQLIDWFKQSA